MDTRDTQVVVIGAGFAGLSAARALEGKRELVVLEARERVGGRAWTSEGPVGVGLEHGAQFFGRDHRRVMELIDALGLRDQVLDYVAEFGDDPVSICDLAGGRHETRVSDTYFQIQGVNARAGLADQARFLAGLASLEGLGRLVDRNNPGASALGRRLDRMTFADYVNRQSLPAWFAELMYCGVRGVWSQAPERMSALYVLWYMRTNGGFSALFNDQDGGPQQYGLRCGLGGLAAELAASLDVPIELNSPVERVERQADGRLLICARGQQLRCEQLIVATTPRALRRIRFEPALSPERRLLANQAGGFAIKAVLVYERPWWREGPKGHIFAWLAGRNSAPGIEWILDATLPSEGVHTLLAFVSPELIDALPEDSPEARAAAVGEAMQRLTETPEAADFSHCALVDWRTEPGIEGGPNTTFGPGILTALAPVWGRPEHGCIHFAGAEYSSSYTGYVEGAIASGRECAEQILRA